MRPRDWVTQYMEGVQWYAGGECLCLCVYHHNTDSPALMVNVNKGVFLCHSCGQKGTLLKLAEDVGHPLIPTLDASDVASNAARLRSKLRKETEELEPVGNKSEAWLAQFTKRRHPYWRERGITDKVRREWQLGYDKGKNAVTIPLWAMNGSILGVIRRSLDSGHGDRWRYPVGFRSQLHLFAAHRLRVHGNDPLVIVEGSIDCIRVSMTDTPCVATLGAHFSTHQQNLIRKLADKRVFVFMDDDDAGHEAQSLIENRLTEDGFEVYRVRYPRRVPVGQERPTDPGDMTLGQIARAIKGARNVRQLRLNDVSRMV